MFALVALVKEGDMKAATGQEMRRLLWAISLMVLLLVVAVIAYFMVDITITYNRNIEDNKDKVIRESVRSLQDMSSLMILGGLPAELMQVFNQEVVMQIISGDLNTLSRYFITVGLNFYPVDYLGFIVDGKLMDSGAKAGIQVDPDELPTTPPEGEYQPLERLGSREGFFVSVFVPVDLGKVVPSLKDRQIYVNMIVDRTEEMEETEAYFRDQRNSLLVRLFIVGAIAAALSLLITTLGLRNLTRKYVVEPIEKMNRQAQEIVEGTFQGEVQVDERSAYAPLQGLLRSGQKVLQRMDEELRD